MTIFVEFDNRDYGVPWWRNFGYFRGPFDGGTFRRIWFMCFAVGWVRKNLYDYNRHVASGQTEWRIQ